MSRNGLRLLELLVLKVIRILLPVVNTLRISSRVGFVGHLRYQTYGVTLAHLRAGIDAALRIGILRTLLKWILHLCLMLLEKLPLILTLIHEVLNRHLLSSCRHLHRLISLINL